MIPKVIHYCWFGKNPLPKMAQRCIKSWKKYCPDYEIIEWNEDNFDINCCAYVKEAYEAKKWAFVSDFARFYILYNYGGVYFDVDVELIKSIDDLRMNGAFMGCENAGIVAPGLGLAVGAKNELFNELLNGYYNRNFKNEDGSYNLTTVVEYTTETLNKYGLKACDNLQKIKEIFIYPKEYLCPKDAHTREVCITSNTVSIHHYDGSWLDKDRRFVQKFTEIFGYQVTKIFIKIKHIFKRGK